MSSPPPPPSPTTTTPSPRDYSKSTKFTYFGADFETTGSDGLPIGHPRNVMIQACAIRYDGPGVEGPLFNELAYPGFPIPPASTKIHRINDRDVLGPHTPKGYPNKKPPPGDVAKALYAWVMKHTREGTTPCLVAHNAPFDRDMFHKSIGGGCAGPSGAELPLVWLDSLAVVREVHPEIGDKFWPHQQPFKLKHILRETVKSLTLDNAHNARADVEGLLRLCEVVVWPRVWDKIERCSGQPRWVTGVILPGKGPVPRKTLLSEVKQVKGTYRLPRIVDAMNTEFENSGDPEFMQLMCNVNTACVGHLVAFGTLSCGDNVTWPGICYAVERLLRNTGLIAKDGDLAIAMSAVCGCSEPELYANMRGDRKDGRLYPSMAGELDAFYPFKFTIDECTALLDQMGIGTSTELFVSYSFDGASDLERRLWLQKFHKCLGREVPMPPSEFQEALDKLKQFRFADDGKGKKKWTGKRKAWGGSKTWKGKWGKRKIGEATKEG